MAITTRYRRRRPLQGLGDLASVLSTASDVAADPYLPELICRIQQLKNINNGQAVAICAETPEGIPGGVGIGNLMMPLRGYVYAQQNKWVYPVAILAILGIPFLLGYRMGEKQ